MSPNTPPVLSDDLVELLSRSRAQAPEADRALRPLESSNGGPVGEASQVLAHAYMPGSAQQTGQEGAAEAGTSTFTQAESGLQDATAPQVKETVRVEASDAALAQLAQELALEQVVTAGSARAASIEDPIAPDSEPSATPGALSMEILGVREKAPQAAIETGSAPNLAVPPADPVTSPSAPTPVAPEGTDVSADMSGVMAQSEESDAFDVTDPLDINAAANSIAENVAAGTAVGIVAHAIDADATRNTVGYSVDDSRFSVDADGTVRVAAGASFDFEAEPAITLNITATSSDGSTASSSFSLGVTDFDEFDVTAPVDINATANSIAENVAAGTAVGIVAHATDADASNNVVSYSIDDSRFSVDADGTVRVAAGASFNAETESLVNLRITANSADGSSASSNFTVAVADVDEFDVSAPVDTNAAANSIAENAAAGTAVGIVANATDADATTNSVSYSVNDSRFSVDADGTVRVASGASFNAESASSVNLRITATSADGSTANRDFSVAVSDVDEFDVTMPVDSDSSANIVREHAAAGSTVGIRVQANDADATNNSVSWSVSDNRFVVAGDGTVRVAAGAQFDNAVESRINLAVTASSTDGSSATQTFGITLAQPTIRIVVDNDFAVFTGGGGNVTSLAHQNNVQWASQLSSGPTINLDLDGGQSHVYVVALGGGGVENIGGLLNGVDITRITGVEQATVNLKPFLQGWNATGIESGSYNVQLLDVQAGLQGSGWSAVPLGSTSNGVSSRLTGRAWNIQSEGVSVFRFQLADARSADVFDVTAPQDRNAAANSIAENAAAGTAVGIVAHATDADASSNAVSYSVDDSRFTVAADGTVRVAAGASFNAETESSVNLRITATSADGSSASSNFTVAVADVDEFDVSAPVDTNAAANSIAENAAAGTAVGIVARATDADASSNAVSYSVDDSRFTVAADGTVRVAAGASFNAETESSVNLRITATSADGSSASSNFTVAVADVDEFDISAPVDTNAAANSIAENAAAGTAVGIVAHATDADASSNAVSYSVDDSRFTIAADGTVRVAAGASFNAETESSVNLRITATSADGSSASSNFTVAVADVDEFDVSAPVDTNAAANSIAENAAAGTAVGIVAHATDADASSNTVSYSVDDSRFTVAADGTVRVAAGASFDFEAEPAITLNITATSADGSTATSSFSLNVTDFDEFDVSAPVDVNNASDRIYSNAAAGSATGIRVAAGDADGSLNSVSYSVNDGRFTVDADGTVRVAAGAGFDHVAEASINLTITATSADGSTASSSFALGVFEPNYAPTDITISAVAPIMEDVVSAGSIGAVNVNAGRTVATLAAVDANSADSFSYSIVGGDAEKYEIVGNEVRVRAGVVLDFETDASDSLGIRVSDSQGATYDKVLNLSITDYEAAATGSSGNDTITGTSEEDVIDGGAGNDSLSGGSGNDSLTGGIGSDSLSGGDGDDVLIDMDDVAGANGDAGNDSISLNLSTVSGGSSWIRGGAGNDQLTLNFANVTLTNKAIAGDGDTSGTNRDLANATDGNDRIIVSGTWTAAGNTVVVLNDGSDYYRNDSTTSGFTVHAGQGNDEIIGGDGASESLSGGGGDDRITGRAGNDTIDGGTGTDTAIYRGNASQYTVSMNTSTGALTLVDGTSGRDGNDVVSNVERFQFADTTLVVTVGGDTSADILTNTGGKTILSGLGGDDTLTAGSSGDLLFGGAGNDTLKGGAGNDTLDGGLGSDTLVLSGNASEYRFTTGVSGYIVVTDLVAGRDGVDNVAGIETFTFSNGSFNLVAGTAGVNSLIGSAVSPSLLIGLEGADTLSGRAQIDVMMGGSSTDTISYGADTAGVTVDLGASTVSGGLAQGDIIAEFENATGGSGNDVLIGSIGGNVLDGGAGNDQLFGDEGNDTLTGGAGADYMDGGLGHDTVNYSAATNALNINLATQTVAGTDAAGDTIVSIEAAIGGSGNDILTGSANDNTLSGGSGNDTIDGGGGSDTIEGGAGSDILSGGAGTDYLSYATSNAGVAINLSTNSASGGHAQGDTISGFEHLIGSASADTLTGSNSNNNIQGGSGDDVIVGMDGDDTLYGQAGNDNISGDLGDDVIEGGAGADQLSGGGGIDTLSYASSGAVTVNLLAGTASGSHATGDSFTGFENITGSSSADTLTGDAGDNVLQGGWGDDLLEGGGGNDTLNGNADIDTASYQSASSGVTVSLAITTAQATGGAGTDTLNNIENLTGSGFNDTLTGDTGANTITGGAGHDIINGAAGIDRLTGGAGNDRLDGGADSDTAVFSGGVGQYSFSRDGAGNVVVSDSIAGRDGVDTISTVENLEFGGSSFSLTSSTTAATVSEAAAAGTQVGQVLSGASYSVSDARFSVDSAGRVRLAAGASLDYEAQSTVSLSVTAVRGSAIVVSRLDLALQDVDEFDVTAPVDLDAAANSIAEDALAGTAVGIVVQAQDADGSNNSISYISSDGRFTVDADGTVRVAAGASFDFETESSIQFKIGASSSDGSSASSAFTLQVSDVAEIKYDKTYSLSSGSDSHWAGAGNDNISGLAGNDSIGGGDGDDYIAGGTGNDSLHGQAGNDTLLGEDGNDVLYGYEGNDTLSGGIGNDELHGNQGNDTLDGGDGNDVLYAHDGDDLLTGGTGNDQLYGDAGNDSLSGGDGNDRLYGHAGDDTFTGGAGNDQMFGDDGSDVLHASSMSGKDAFDGGAGGGWIDTIQIDHATPAGQTLPWDIQVNGVSLSLDPNSNGIELGQDVSGSLVFDDGSSISFDNVERIAW